jgi:hypothetical protein
MYYAYYYVFYVNINHSLYEIILFIYLEIHVCSYKRQTIVFMINTDNKTILICYNIEMYGMLYKPETRHWCPV